MSLQTLPTQLDVLDSLKAAYDAAQAEARRLGNEYNAQAQVVAAIVDQAGFGGMQPQGVNVDKLALARNLAAQVSAMFAPVVVPGGSDGGDL